MKHLETFSNKLIGITFFMFFVSILTNCILPDMIVLVMFIITTLLSIITILVILKSKKKVYGLICALIIFFPSISLSIGIYVSYRYNALSRAIENGNLTKINELITQGYNVNSLCSSGQNMLTLTFWYPYPNKNLFSDEPIIRLNKEEKEAKILDMMELLINNGADVNSIDRTGTAPIHIAVNRGYLNIIELLIRKGANVNLRDAWGDTPLHIIAPKKENNKIARILIENGADVNAKNSYKMTPLALAENEGNEEYADILRENGAIKEN